MTAAGHGARRGRGGRCAVCRRRKEKVHRNRRTGKLVCPACADRARMKVLACAECGERKLIQARGRCYACYKRQWRSGHLAAASAIVAAARRRSRGRAPGTRAGDTVVR